MAFVQVYIAVEKAAEHTAFRVGYFIAKVLSIPVYLTILTFVVQVIAVNHALGKSFSLSVPFQGGDDSLYDTISGWFITGTPSWFSAWVLTGSYFLYFS
eukprot:UN26753